MTFLKPVGAVYPQIFVSNILDDFFEQIIVNLAFTNLEVIRVTDLRTVDETNILRTTI